MFLFLKYSSSAVLMFLLAPLTIFVSRKLQILDLPNERKVHIHYISRLGGIAIFLSVWLAVLILQQSGNIVFNESIWTIIFFGSLFAFFVGLWDDLKNISAKHKLVLQIILGIIATKLGFEISEIQLGFGRTIHFGHFSMIVSVFWIVMVMNAFNMIDGLDGLAAGFGFLVFSTLTILGYLNGNHNIAIFSLVCAGSCMGFLFFNFHPAKIFMGDSGSMMLGYILAIFSISVGSIQGSTNVFMPIFLLAFPLIDLSTAVLRRMIHAKVNDKEISYLGLLRRTFDADGNHIHHRLLKLGFSQRKIAFLIYAFTIISCCLALLSVYFSFGLIFFLFIFYVWFTVQSIRLLDYEEFVTSSYRNQKKDFEEKRKLSTAPMLIKKVN